MAAFVVKICICPSEKKSKRTESLRHVSPLYFESMAISADDLFNLNLIRLLEEFI